MKRLLFYIVGILIGYWLLFGLLVYFAPTSQSSPLYNRGLVLDIGVKLFSGFATFLAVCVSLFGSTVIKKFKQPCLNLNVGCDDVHCVLSEDDDGRVADTIIKKLRVFVSVKNVSEVDAVDSQLVCNRAFISKDGERFVQYQTFRAASFKWLYSSDDAKFLTTLRRSVEKYAEVFEVIEQKETLSEDGKIDVDSSSNRKVLRSTSLAVCLAVKKEDSRSVATRYIEIPREYRAILLPICLASSSTAPKTYYVKIYWKGEMLDKFPTKDKLELKCLTRQEAQNAVEVKLD